MATTTARTATTDRPSTAVGPGRPVANADGEAEDGRRRKHVPGFELDCRTGAEVRHVGIVFVHGIGDQEPGETLLDWGGAIAGLLLDVRLAEETAADPVISSDLDPVPSKSRFIELQLPGFPSDGPTAIEEHWVMTEAWWAQRVRPPPFGKMAEWLGPRGAIRRIVLAMLPHEKKHDPRRRPDAVPYTMRRSAESDKKDAEEAAEQGNIVGQLLDELRTRQTRPVFGGFFKLGKISAGLYLQAISGLLLVLYGALRSIEKLVPIGPIRNGALTRPIDRFMLDWFGDVYVLLDDPPQAASVRGRLVDALRDLKAARCETIAIVAHSGGAIVSYMTLADPAIRDITVHRLITLGEGLNLAWRLIGEENDPDQVTIHRYERLYSNVFERWPELQWDDFWASEDPAPVGVLNPRGGTLDDIPLDRITSHSIWNRLAVGQDHGSYWDNDEEFLVPLVRLLTKKVPENVFKAPDPSNRRRRRLSILSVGRQLSLVAPTAAIMTAYAVGSPFLQRASDAVADAWSAIPGAELFNAPFNALRAFELQKQSPWFVLADAGNWIIVGLLAAITLFALVPPIQRPVPWGRDGDKRWIHHLLELGPWIVAVLVMVATLRAGIRLAEQLTQPGVQIFVVLIGFITEVAMISLVVVAVLGKPFTYDKNRTHPKFWDAVEVSLTILVLLLATFIAVAPFFSILAYPETGRVVLGCITVFAAFRVLGRIGIWRWNVWDGRERAALRAGETKYPPLARVKIQFSLLIATTAVLFVAIVANSVELLGLAGLGASISVLLGVSVDVFSAARQERRPSDMGTPSEQTELA